MQRVVARGMVPYLFIYLAFTSFAVTVVVHAVKWARLPMHVRWELYPVPHEPANKVHYGGSYMEETGWWQRPRSKSRLGPTRAALAEIVWFESIRKHNGTLWWRTLTFHWGLYLSGASVVLALLVGVAQVLMPQLRDGASGMSMRYAVIVPGVMGLMLGVMGALSLLHRRLSWPALRNFTVPADIYNLVLFVVAFGCGLITFATVDQDAERALRFARNLVCFRMIPLTGSGLEVVMPATTLAIMALLIAYIPLTHMSHFVGKYFAYHAIRWNDEPNLAGGRQEALIQRQLAYKVTWAARHIAAAGGKSWAELAVQENTEQES